MTNIKETKKHRQRETERERERERERVRKRRYNVLTSVFAGWLAGWLARKSVVSGQTPLHELAFPANLVKFQRVDMCNDVWLSACQQRTIRLLGQLALVYIGD